MLHELTDDVLKGLLEEVDLKNLFKRLKDGCAHPVFRRACTPAFLIAGKHMGRGSVVMRPVSDQTGQHIGRRPVQTIGSCNVSEYNMDVNILEVDENVGPFDDPSILWDTVLSVGEQQKLQFARLLWHFDWLQNHKPVH